MEVKVKSTAESTEISSDIRLIPALKPQAAVVSSKDTRANITESQTGRDNSNNKLITQWRSYGLISLTKG